MRRKGQVTLFVIIAIVIVVAVALIYVFRGEAEGTDSQDISPLSSSVNSFVISCIEESIGPAVYLVGQGGGYAYPPYNLSDIDGFTYYFLNNNVYLPGLKNIEDNLERTVEGDVLVCVDSFKDFPDLDISSRRINVDAEILEDSIIFSISYPIRIEKGSESAVLEDFGRFEVEERLGEIYSIVENLVRNDVYNEGFVCLSCISDAAYENNLTIDFLEGEEYGSIFVIKDDAQFVGDDEVNTYFDDETNREEVFKFIFASD